MKKRSLNSKLKLNKMTVSSLTEVKGGNAINWRICGTGDCGGGGTAINTYYTHRPCDTAAYNAHCARTTCEEVYPM